MNILNWLCSIIVTTVSICGHHNQTNHSVIHSNNLNSNVTEFELKTENLTPEYLSVLKQKQQLSSTTVDWNNLPPNKSTKNILLKSQFNSKHENVSTWNYLDHQLKRIVKESGYLWNRMNKQTIRLWNESTRWFQKHQTIQTIIMFTLFIILVTLTILLWYQTIRKGSGNRQQRKIHCRSTNDERCYLLVPNQTDELTDVET